VLVSPAPYILMLGLLFQFLSGGEAPFLFYASLVALFSVAYISLGGFAAVIRTDILQMVLMFAGFIVMLVMAVRYFGGAEPLMESLTPIHLDITGGNSWGYLLVWFFIALWTFVDPSFHQRAAAARTPETARKGIFISIGFWAVFDILTCFTGLYAFAILGPGLEQPVLAYPMLAEVILPVGLKGLFYVALLATIMSTLDSYLFISGQTLGRDYLLRYFPGVEPNRLTRISILISALLGIALMYVYPSVIDLWYVIGSVFIPGLLIPVLGVYLPVFRLTPTLATATLAGATGVSLLWLMLGTMQPDGDLGYTFLGVEPFYPGLMVALMLWGVSRGTKAMGG
jgi:solute:Na+ symporter, SSS family